jgi:hypothetical protein
MIRERVTKRWAKETPVSLCLTLFELVSETRALKPLKYPAKIGFRLGELNSTQSSLDLQGRF